MKWKGYSWGRLLFLGNNDNNGLNGNNNLNNNGRFVGIVKPSTLGLLLSYAFLLERILFEHPVFVCILNSLFWPGLIPCLFCSLGKRFYFS